MTLTTTWMTCTWIWNKGSDTSSDFGEYSFFVGSPKVVTPVAPHISVRLQIYRHSHQSVSQMHAWQLSTKLSTTHLSDKTITMQIQISAISTRNQLYSGGFRTNELGRASCSNEGYSNFINSLRRNTQVNQSEVTRWKLVQSTHTRSSSPSTACSGKKVILNRSLCANVFQNFVLAASFAISDTEPSILVDLT